MKNLFVLAIFQIGSKTRAVFSLTISVFSLTISVFSLLFSGPIFAIDTQFAAESAAKLKEWLSHKPNPKFPLNVVSISGFNSNDEPVFNQIEGIESGNGSFYRSINSAELSFALRISEGWKQTTEKQKKDSESLFFNIARISPVDILFVKADGVAKYTKIIVNNGKKINSDNSNDSAKFVKLTIGKINVPFDNKSAALSAVSKYFGFNATLESQAGNWLFLASVQTVPAGTQGVLFEQSDDTLFVDRNQAKTRCVFEVGACLKSFCIARPVIGTCQNSENGFAKRAWILQ